MHACTIHFCGRQSGPGGGGGGGEEGRGAGFSSINIWRCSTNDYAKCLDYRVEGLHCLQQV